MTIRYERQFFYVCDLISKAGLSSIISIPFAFYDITGKIAFAFKAMFGSGSGTMPILIDLGSCILKCIRISLDFLDLGPFTYRGPIELKLEPKNESN